MGRSFSLPEPYNCWLVGLRYVVSLIWEWRMNLCVKERISQADKQCLDFIFRVREVKRDRHNISWESPKYTSGICCSIVELVVPMLYFNSLNFSSIYPNIPSPFTPSPVTLSLMPS